MDSSEALGKMDSSNQEASGPGKTESSNPVGGVGGGGACAVSTLVPDGLELVSSALVKTSRSCVLCVLELSMPVMSALVQYVLELVPLMPVKISSFACVLELSTPVTSLVQYVIR